MRFSLLLLLIACIAMFASVEGQLTEDQVKELTNKTLEKRGLDQKQLAKKFVNLLKKEELVVLDEAMHSAAFG